MPTHELPHARVVAIESEREFGLSVLQRLDAELKHPRRKFRDAGVQRCRRLPARPTRTRRLPRILLIVDEFQEFFVEDDKIGPGSRAAARPAGAARPCVRHCTCCSARKRSAGRIRWPAARSARWRCASRCNAARPTRNLILSEDNSRRPVAVAARRSDLQRRQRPDRRQRSVPSRLAAGRTPRKMLSPICTRPGSKPGRRCRRSCSKATCRPKSARIVLLDRLLAAADWPEIAARSPAWLGEAIAIKDPTAAVFRPQSGSNLLMIGQHEEASLSIFTSAILSLAATHRPEGDTPLAAASTFSTARLPMTSTPITWRNLPTACRIRCKTPISSASRKRWPNSPIW